MSSLSTLLLLIKRISRNGIDPILGEFQYRQRIQEVVNACFDIHVEIPRIGEHILDRRPGEGSADIRSRVEYARAKQYYRYIERSQFWVNTDLESADDVHRFCGMSSPSEKLLQDAIQQLHFTPQKILRLLCLARMIADLSHRR